MRGRNRTGQVAAVGDGVVYPTFSCGSLVDPQSSLLTFDAGNGVLLASLAPPGAAPFHGSSFAARMRAVLDAWPVSAVADSP